MMYFDFLGAMLSAFSVILSPTQSGEESRKSSQHTVIYSLMAISRKPDSSLRSE